MTDLQDYHRELMSDIRREADAVGIMMVEAFFERMAERITESGELEVAERAFFQSGEGNQKLRVDGYGGNPRDSEGILGLIVCDFVDSDQLSSFGKSDIPPLLNPLIRFLKKARTEAFRDSLNEINPGFQLSDLMITTWSYVTKIKLILLSNRQYIGRDDAVKLSDSLGVPITYSVWDLARFERFDRSGQAREDMTIDFSTDFGGPLPALKASQDGSALESYLLIVPGQQLAAIYDKWGARLLEANVRTFLQARAKTNKGIQKTIRDEPELFFPYNNGLSATAEKVDCLQTKSGFAISAIRNLQIVNGAQTTGSIHAALRGARDQLSKVFVQMKLTVVPPERSEDIVPRISEFANTQNKVNAADFSSNQPFHVRMEHYSRDVLFAAREGERHDSKWFYERSRGQYINARNSSRLKKFDLEFPKAQVFSKTDLAKFEYSAAGLPHIVSRGAQKNFADFAKQIADEWEKDDVKFDELWFKRLISKAIIFRKLEAEIPKQSWYEGGYRANIVTYAMSKVFHDAQGSESTLDLDVIWRRQMVSDPLARALLIAAKAAHHTITNPPSGVRNMSEWAKQQACWHALKTVKLEYEADFHTCLVDKDDARAAQREARSQRTMSDGIGAQMAVVSLGGEHWDDVLRWGRINRRLSPVEMQVLEVCAAIPRKMPNEVQSKHAMAILDRLRQQGLE